MLLKILQKLSFRMQHLQAQTTSNQPERHFSLQVLFLRNMQVLVTSLGDFIRTPWNNLLNSAVIGIILVIPSGFFLLLQNANQLVADGQRPSQLMVFLEREISLEQAEKLRQDLLEKETDIITIEVISNEQSLAEYREYSGLADIVDQLESNPFPHVLSLTLTEEYNQQTANINSLINRISTLAEVEIVSQDQQWIARFLALLTITWRSMVILSFMFALAILLIIGNTIRLSVNTYRQQIEIEKLFGASNMFIYRPFLYYGFWQGFFGAIFAGCLLYLSLLLLREPLQNLIRLYGDQFQPITPNWVFFLILLSIAVVLGLLGSWFSVAHQIRAIEPDSDPASG